VLLASFTEGSNPRIVTVNSGASPRRRRIQA
jgi:hypothetical protein